jgi:hypothetical protein
MAVETYLIDEVESLVHSVEDLEEWNKLVEQCKLDGQKTLTKEDKSPIPFPAMTDQMEKVYEILCPTKFEVDKFSRTTIPVRILSLIALCQQEGYFDALEVWSDDKAPDPILVGVKKDPESSWRKIYYLIGRWGDELRSYPELVKIAKQKHMEKMRARVRQTLLDCQTKLDNLETYVDSEFEGKSVYWPS